MTGPVPGDTGGPHVRLGLVWTAVVVAAAFVGPVALAVPMALTAAVAIAQVARLHRRARRLVPIGVLILAAAASPVVVLLEADRVVAVVLLVSVAFYDAAVFIVGSGSRNRWEGPAAGMVTLAPLTLLVAAVLAPPFDGASPWILGGLTAVLAPFGAPLATRLVGAEAAAGKGARLGALRRLDTLLLVGPAWMIAVAALHL